MAGRSNQKRQVFFVAVVVVVIIAACFVTCSFTCRKFAAEVYRYACSGRHCLNRRRHQLCMMMGGLTGFASMAAALCILAVAQRNKMHCRLTASQNW